MARFITATKLARARTIPDSAMVEWAIISEQPVIAYARITGSDAEPYRILIDASKTTTGLVGCDCRDFKDRGSATSWCKHLGKLLLQLPKGSQQSLDEVRFRLLKTTKALDQQITQLKTQQLASEPEGNSTELSLIDQLNILLQSPSQKPRIIEAIQQTLAHICQQKDAYQALLAFIDALNHFEQDLQSQLFRTLQKQLETYVHQAITALIPHFWTRPLLTRLEWASVLGPLLPFCSQSKQLDQLYFPHQANKHDPYQCVDLWLWLCYLLEWQTGDLKQAAQQANQMLAKQDCTFSTEQLEQRKRRLVFEAQLAPGLPQSLKKRLLTIAGQNQLYSPYPDELLIHLVKSGGGRPIHDLQQDDHHFFSTSTTLYHFPQTLLHDYPALSFVLEHIKTSPREYLTEAEIKAHSKFFQWLSGKKFESEWEERPRERVLDTTLAGIHEGIIIQWDIAAHQSAPGRLYTQHQGHAILPAPGTVTAQLQPFDFTLCHPQMLARGLWTRIAQPLWILQPDQVVTLIQHGHPVISQLLPWQTLADAVHHAVAYGHLRTAITDCQRSRFIYGSLVLESALAQLIRIARSGLTEAQYQQQRELLNRESGRLNTQTKQQTQSILAGEGDNLALLCQALQLSEDDCARAIIKIARKTETLAQFRSALADELVTRGLKQPNTLDGRLFHLLEQDLSPHQAAKSTLQKKLQRNLNALRKQLQQPNLPSRQSINANPLGAMLMTVIGANKTRIHSNISQQEQQALLAALAQLTS